MRFINRHGDLLSRTALFVVFVVVLSIITPGFFSFYALAPLIAGFAILGLLALGLAVTMIAGELDLSVASVAAASAVLAVVLRDLGPVPAILLSILIATAFGALQGYLVSRLGISSLMLTLASLIGVRGVAYLLSGNSTISLPSDDFPAIDILTAPIAQVFTLASLMALVLFLGVGLFLALSKWGREIYAIGGGREQSRGAGISSRRPMTLAFAISGLCAGTAGAMSAWTQGAAIPTGFELVLLPAATAALVGGIALSGGRGTVLNVVVGTLIIQLLTIYLTSIGAASYAQSLLTGLVLLVVLVVEFVTDRRLRRRLTAGRLARNTGRLIGKREMA